MDDRERVRINSLLLMVDDLTAPLSRATLSVSAASPLDPVLCAELGQCVRIVRQMRELLKQGLVDARNDVADAEEKERGAVSEAWTGRVITLTTPASKGREAFTDQISMETLYHLFRERLNADVWTEQQTPPRRRPRWQDTEAGDGQAGRQPDRNTALRNRENGGALAS